MIQEAQLLEWQRKREDDRKWLDDQATRQHKWAVTNLVVAVFLDLVSGIVGLVAGSKLPLFRPFDDSAPNEVRVINQQPRPALPAPEPK